MKILSVKLLGLGLLLSFLATSCRNGLAEYDITLRAPIARASVDLKNLVLDSYLVNGPSGYRLAYQNTFNIIELSDLLRVPDTSLKNNVSLRKISLGNRTVRQTVTLGRVASNAGFVGLVIKGRHGTRAPIPKLDGLTSGATPIDATSLFEEATFVDGTLILSITNGFPVPLTDVSFNITYQTFPGELLNDKFLLINPGETVVRNYSLAGKTVEGRMVANITSLSTPGTNGDSVLIDTSDALIVDLSARDMSVLKARAIFPAQNVVDDDVDIVYNLAPAELTYMRIKRGVVRIRAGHTLPEGLTLEYAIPSATLNGVPFFQRRYLEAAEPGDTTYREEDIPVDNYEVDLRGRTGMGFNTFTNHLVARIDSSGIVKDLALDDSVVVDYGLFEVVPEYVKGYLGKSSFLSGLQTETLDGFPGIKSGEITLDSIEVRLVINNGIGADGRLDLKKLMAKNSSTGREVALTGSFLNAPINLPRALDNPLRPSSTTIVLDQSNSNILEVLKLAPDKLEYELDVDINPNGNTSAHNDFLYDVSTVTVDLQVSSPLRVGLNGVTLEDTLKFNFDQIDPISTERIQDIDIDFLVDNRFPLGITAQVYILAEGNVIIDSVFKTPARIMPGLATGTNYAQIMNTQSQFTGRIKRELLNIFLGEQTLIIRLRLDTPNGGDPVSLFDTYGADVKASARLKYRNAL